MRILYLNPSGQLGGAELSLLDLVASIRAVEPDSELHLLMGEDGPLAARARALGVRVEVLPFPRALARLGDSGTPALTLLPAAIRAMAGTLLYTLRLRRKILALNPDVIHTNGFKMHLLAIWARTGGRPVLWHVRDNVSSRRAMKHLLRLHASRCAAALGNSKNVTDDIQQTCGGRVQATCVYNAVDLQRYSPEGETTDLDASSGLPSTGLKTLRIGMIATMARWKGHAVFLRALARVAGKLDFRAYVIGGAIYQTDNSQQTLQELRDLASSLGIAKNVGFTGFVQEPAAAMRALDIIVHASTQPEPFGRVIAEGMACGRPVICSAAGGAAELITPEHDALSHPPGDDAALADRILRLAQDPDLRARLGHAARTTAEARFNVARLATEVIPIYRRISRVPAAPSTASAGFSQV